MSDMIRFTCGVCGKRLKAPGELAGKRVKCGCGQSQLVPEPLPLEPNEEDIASKSSGPRPKSRKFVYVLAGLGFLVALGLGGWFAYNLMSRTKVDECYVDQGCVVIDQEFRTQPDHVVLIVKAKAPADEKAPEAKIIGADGVAWKYGALDRPGEKDGGNKSIVHFYFPIPRKAVEGGGLKFKYKDQSPLALPGSIEFRESNRTGRAGNLVPAIQLR